ncbi:exopolysaccharide biosynthesis protein [Rhizobiales bacterium TNE-4]|nr:exopolysaccharide biosynthesis protein [Rhizobiales bacterium TNE-4]MBV1827448.1 exopolysaccharide biosynthesis protein [Rhizobiales bacterium TNE-4]
MLQLHHRTSDTLPALAVAGEGPGITLRAIMKTLGERGFALLVVGLGLPNCLPMPPPIPLLCGLLLIFVALQMVLGWNTPWLPGFLLDKTVSRATMANFIERAMPWVRKLERVAKPRFGIVDSRLAFRLIGSALMMFSVALVCAAPFIGQVPLGVAVVLIGLGLVERDGLLVLGGIAVGLVGTALSLGFVFALATGAAAIF